jgi:ornithine decarboxylase
LFIIDAARVRAQYRRLGAALPSVDLHYALKPLPHAAVIQTLSAEGAYFDLATNGEVDLVQRCGIRPERCIHTHPIKRDSDIRTALDYGVNVFVIDNPDELRKFIPFRNRAAVLIRVCFRSPDAVCDLSKKFGCAPDAVAELLGLAAELRIETRGFSFHVGSQAADSGMHVKAIQVCRELLRDAAKSGHDLSIVDIGGGFPVDYSINVRPFAARWIHSRPTSASSPSRVATLRLPLPSRYRPSWAARCATAGGGTTSTMVCTAATAVRCTITRNTQLKHW